MKWSDYPTNSAALLAAARHLGMTADDLPADPYDTDEVRRWKQVARLVDLDFPAYSARANVHDKLATH